RVRALTDVAKSSTYLIHSACRMRGFWGPLNGNRYLTSRRARRCNTGGPHPSPDRVAAAAVSFRPVHRQLSGSHQRRVCGDRNVSRPGVQRPRVWPGRGRVLYRLPGAADSGVAAGGELERAENDLGVDGGLGISDGAYGDGAYADAALPGAILTGAGGGELFSGGDGLCESLVHPERQGEGGEQLHGGDSAVVDDWVAVGGMDCRAPLAGVRGLAVAVCAGGNAGSGTGRDRVSLAAGLAEGCGVALARAARVDYTRIGVGEASGTTRRVGAGDAAVGASAAAGGGVISGLPAGVCGDLLDSDAAEAPDGVVRCAGGVAAGDSVRSGAGGDAVQRMAFGQAVGAALAHRGSAAAGGAGGGGG